MKSKIKKALFMDRDGTLIKHIPYLADPNLIKLTKGVIGCLNTLKKNNYSLIVVTNQSGVARGYFNEDTVISMNKRLLDIIVESGGPVIDGVYYCPHYSSGVIPEYSVCCNCRKPAPGMIEQAVKDHNIDVKTSVMIGDSYIKDVLMGLALGMRAILIAPRVTELPSGVTAVVDDFTAVADIVLRTEGIHN